MGRGLNQRLLIRWVLVAAGVDVVQLLPAAGRRRVRGARLRNIVKAPKGGLDSRAAGYGRAERIDRLADPEYPRLPGAERERQPVQCAHKDVPDVQPLSESEWRAHFVYDGAGRVSA